MNYKSSIIILFFLMPISAPSHSESFKITQEEFQKIKERIQTLENSAEIQRHTLQTSIESNDKHIGDFGVLVTMQGTQATWLSVLITLIAATAGVLSYFHTVAHAKNLAKDAAEKWFQDEAKNLQQQILDLKNKSDKAHIDIENIFKGFLSTTETLREQVLKEANFIMQNKHAGDVKKDDRTYSSENIRIASDELKTRPESSFTADDYFIRGVDQFSEENWHGASASFKKAVELGRLSKSDELGRYLSALGSAFTNMKRYGDSIKIYDEVENTYKSSDDPEVRDIVASALVGKARALSFLNKPIEEMKVYDLFFQRYGHYTDIDMMENIGLALFNKAIAHQKNDDIIEMMDIFAKIDERYGDIDSDILKDVVGDALLIMALQHQKEEKYEQEYSIYKKINEKYNSDSIMTEIVGRANNYHAFSLIVRAKKDWTTKDLRVSHLNSAREMAILSLSKAKNQHNINYATGNLGYIYFLLGNKKEAKVHTEICLAQGGKEMLDSQRGDAMIERIEPEDTDYEEILEEIWKALQRDAK